MDDENFDFATEEDLLNRMYKRALQRQATPSPGIANYGNRVMVLPGWGQVAGAAFDQARGALDEDATVAALRGLGQRRLAAQQAYLAQMPQAFEERQQEISGPPTPEQEKTGMGTSTVQVEKPLLQQAREWQQFGARGMTVPGMEKIGALGLQKAMEMPQRLAEQEEKAKDRAAQQAVAVAAAKEAAATRAEAAATQNAIVNEIRRGNLDVARQRADIAQAEENRKREAADAKIAAGERDAQEAKDNLESLIDDIQSKYDKLNEKKGITSTERGALPNTISSLRASGVGQTAGRIIGSEEQTIRDEIKSSRQQLLMAIAKRLGVKSSQLNSNVELQSWLSALTDPSLGYETNTGILQKLRSRYVDGKETPTETPPAAPTPPAGSPYIPGKSSVLPQARGSRNSPVLVTSQEQYDKLNVGDWYTDASGKPFQKKAR